MKKLFILCCLLSFGMAGFNQLNAQGVGEFSYQVSFPSGSFKDFVGKTSFVGFSGMGRGYLKNEQLSIGGSFSWFYFPDKKGKQTLELGDEGGVYTGNLTNYTNIYGLMAIVQYDFKKRKEPMVPFIRAGIGGAYQNQHQDIGLYAFQSDGVQFMMNGEVGIRFNYGYNGLVIAATYHNLPAAGDVKATSFFGVKLGFSSSKY